MPSSKVIWPSKNLQNKGPLKSNHLDLHSANFCDLCLKRERAAYFYCKTMQMRKPKIKGGLLNFLKDIQSQQIAFFIQIPNSVHILHCFGAIGLFSSTLNEETLELSSFWEERFIIHLVFIYFTSFRKIIQSKNTHLLEECCSDEIRRIRRVLEFQG